MGEKNLLRNTGLDPVETSQPLSRTQSALEIILHQLHLIDRNQKVIILPTSICKRKAI